MTNTKPTLDSSSLPPLPPLPDRELRAPLDSPIAGAQAALSRPAMTVGLGRRPAATRRVASFWQKAGYVLKPVLITPVAVGVGMTVGFLAIGAVAGAALPGLTVGGGMIMAGMLGSGPISGAMGILQLVGIFQAVSRMRTSRKQLANILEDRRIRKKFGKGGSQPGRALPRARR